MAKMGVAVKRESQCGPGNVHKECQKILFHGTAAPLELLGMPSQELSIALTKKLAVSSDSSVKERGLALSGLNIQALRKSSRAQYLYSLRKVIFYNAMLQFRSN